MNFAKFSVNRPVAVTMRIASLVLLGAICLTKLPVDLLPNVSIPTVAVITNWGNTAPEVVEAEVTRPIEEAVSSVQGLYEVDSSSTQGSSVVRVQFQWGTNIGQGAVDVLQLVQRAQQSFPTGDPTLQNPIVFKYDPTQLPILIYGVTGMSNDVKLRTLLDNEITPILESADGVAAAITTGGNTRAVIVDVDPVKLQAYHLTILDIVNRISQENENVPAGIAKQSKTEYTIRSLGWFINPQQISHIPVGSYNGQLIYMNQVAIVKDSHPETRLYTRLNGQPAVGVIITKQSAANTIATSNAVKEKLQEVHKLYPQLKFGLAYDQAQFIQASIDDVELNALLGGVLAVLILLFFLRNIRSTLVVALSIPISIISTFALLYISGFTLNTMTLGGLALSAGLIVDDAVVVLENIFRHIERDKLKPAEAAVSGTNEIVTAVVASTLTIMVVFLPLLLIKGQAGQMFTSFAMVVIFSISISLLDATTVVPMLASRFISGEAHHEKIAGVKHNLLERAFARFGVWFDALDNSYRNGLKWAIHHRIWVIAGAIIISLASLLLVPQIGTELMPATDSGDFNITVKMPVGTALSVTNATMKKIEAILLKNPNVATVFSSAGTTLSLRGTTTSLATYEGSCQVKLKDNRKETTQQVINQLRQQFAKIPGARAMPYQFDIVSMLMTGGFQNVEVDIFGNDLNTLYKLGMEVEKRIRGVSGLQNVDINWQQATPEIQWNVDRQKAEQMGVSFQEIASTINDATNGFIASYYQEGGFEYPIIVQMPQDMRKTIPEMNDMLINSSMPNSNGISHDVLLRQVAKPVFAMGPSEITRLNRQRYIAVSGQPQGRSEGQIQDDIAKDLKGMKFPPGYYWSWGTNQLRRAQEFSGMGLAVFLAIGLIYMLLASQFESFVHPLTILLSVPLSAIGVILALFLTGRTFGLTAFIGILMLVGIVVKNGILLIDYTNLLRTRGFERDEAVLTAGPTRLRPILMTASAAILGMMPLVIGLGKGSETNAPMATAVTGGLLTSTILTLFIVPVVYTLFDDLALKFRKHQTETSAIQPPEPAD